MDQSKKLMPMPSPPETAAKIDILRAMSESKLMNPAMVDKLLKEEFDRMMKHPPIFMGVDHATPDQQQSSIIIRKPQMPDFNTGRPTPLEMIAMRLHYHKLVPDNSTPVAAFKYIDAYHKDGKAYVFVVNNNGEAVILTDDAGLFPSDSLITQLRMLAE